MLFLICPPFSAALRYFTRPHVAGKQRASINAHLPPGQPLARGWLPSAPPRHTQVPEAQDAGAVGHDDDVHLAAPRLQEVADVAPVRAPDVQPLRRMGVGGRGVGQAKWCEVGGLMSRVWRFEAAPAIIASPSLHSPPPPTSGLKFRVCSSFAAKEFRQKARKRSPIRPLGCLEVEKTD